LRCRRMNGCRGPLLRRRNCLGCFGITKKKVLLVAAVGGGAYVFFKVKGIMEEFRTNWAMMQQGFDQNTTRQMQVKQRLDNNLRIAESTLIDFAYRNIRQQLSTIFDLAPLQAGLKDRAGGHNVDLWSEFNVKGCARTLTSVYSVCFLDLLLKLQLSIISRYTMEDPGQSVNEANMIFMNLSRYLQTDGLKLLATEIELKIKDALGKWTLQSPCSFADFSTIISSFRDSFEAASREVISSKENEKKHFTEQFSPSSSQQHSPPFADFIFPPPSVFQYPTPPRAGSAPAEQQVARNMLASSPYLLNSNGQPLLTGPGTVPNMVRLAEMVEELRSLLRTPSLQRTLQATLNAAFRALENEVQVIFNTPKLPFAKVITRLVKVFEVFFPSQSSEPSSLFKAISNLPATNQLCSVVFCPFEDTLRPKPPPAPIPPNGAAPPFPPFFPPGGFASSFSQPGDRQTPLALPLPPGSVPPRAIAQQMQGLPAFNTL